MNYVTIKNGVVTPIQERKQLYYYKSGINYNTELIYDISSMPASGVEYRRISFSNVVDKDIIIIQALSKKPIRGSKWFGAIGSSTSVIDNNGAFIQTSGNYKYNLVFSDWKKVNGETGVGSLQNTLTPPIIDNELKNEYPYSGQASIIYTIEYGFMLNKEHIVKGEIKETDYIINSINKGTNYVTINSVGLEYGLRYRIFKATKI